MRGPRTGEGRNLRRHEEVEPEVQHRCRTTQSQRPRRVGVRVRAGPGGLSKGRRRGCRPVSRPRPHLGLTPHSIGRRRHGGRGIKTDRRCLGRRHGLGAIRTDHGLGGPFVIHLNRLAARRTLKLNGHDGYLFQQGIQAYRGFRTSTATAPPRAGTTYLLKRPYGSETAGPRQRASTGGWLRIGPP
jgi:hypothetical protein